MKIKTSLTNAALLTSAFFLLTLLSACSSTTGQTPPPPPTYNVTLAWDANPASDNVISYIIYERLGSTTFTYTSVKTVAAPVVTTTLSAVPGGVHTWVATAVNAVAESAYSLPATGTVPTPPAAPQNLKATVFKAP